MPDAAQLRDDVGAFAEHVLGRPLWPHQAEAARCSKFITVIAKARRTGGTELVKALAAWTCFRERGVKAVILSAGQEASRRITEELGADLAASRLARASVTDDFATRIKLSNGSEIISLPASQRAVRGLGRGVKLVVVDEAGFVAEELWRAAHYVALDERANGSRILLVGTPWGGPELFFRRAYEAGRDGSPDHESFHWTFEVNPRLDRAYLERQRERVSPSEYAAEVLGEWSDAAGALFPQALLERQTADIDVPALADLRGPARARVGADWGVGFDRTAAALIYRLPIAALNPDRERRPVFVGFPIVWPQGYPMNDAAREIATAPGAFSWITTEVNGVGAGPSEELIYQLRRRRRRRARVHPVHTTNATKTAAYGAVLGLLEREQLVLPRHPALLRQLAGLRFEQGARGFTRIESEDAAVHDDVADALALAMGPYRQERASRVRCALPVLATKHAAEATLAPLDEATVETAAGLRLYRRAVVQSVDGLEVTLPADATIARPDTLTESPWMRGY